MSQKKYKFSRSVSPVGVANWTFLDRPNKPYKEGDKPKFQITVGLEDTTETREYIEGIISNAKKEAAEAGVKLKKVFHNPFQFPEDLEEDDIEKQPEYMRGTIIFKSTSEYQPGQIDTSRQDLPDNIKIMSRDKVRVKYIVEPYLNGTNSGIILRLLTVQLVEKDTAYGAGRGGNHGEGFDDIDGYVAPRDNTEESEEDDF